MTDLMIFVLLLPTPCRIQPIPKLQITSTDNSPPPPRQSDDGFVCILCALHPVHVELCKDNNVFGHGAQASNQPRQVLHHISRLIGVEQDPRAVGEIAHQRQNEEQE